MTADTLTDAVRLFTSNGHISEETFTVDSDGTDRKGNFLLQQIGSTRKVRTHPSRLLPIKDGGASVMRGEDSLKAKCPKCHTEIAVDVGAVASCTNCGQFDLDWRDVESGPLPMTEVEIAGKTPKPAATKKETKPKTTKQPKVPTDVDFKTMKAAGEVWTKSNVDFDYPEFDVKAHTYIVVTGKPRKLFFNSYNGTYGKKARHAEVEALIADKLHDNKVVGFYIKGTVDQERKKLEKSGYVKEE